MPANQSVTWVRGTLRALGAIATAMVGLRSAKAREKDFAMLKPLHIVTAGVIIATGIIVTLIVLVNLIAS